MYVRINLDKAWLIVLSFPSSQSTKLDIDWSWNVQWFHESFCRRNPYTKLVEKIIHHKRASTLALTRKKISATAASPTATYASEIQNSGVWNSGTQNNHHNSISCEINIILGLRCLNLGLESAENLLSATSYRTNNGLHCDFFQLCVWPPGECCGAGRNSTKKSIII